MTRSQLLLARADAVATITINRPDRLNALNALAIDELKAVLLEVREDADVRAVVITGAGDKSFVAGADIAELSRLSAIDAQLTARRGQQVFDLIETVGKPVIAAINGFALGGGCELAMACTLRIAADTARLGQPEINLGLIPGYGGSQRLPRLVGRGRALELLLRGHQIDAAEAYRIGLVDRVVPAAELMPSAVALGRELAGKAPLAMRAILDAVHAGLQMPFAEAQAHEAALFGLVSTTEDMQEGTRAFLEKRKPAFKGR